MICVVPLPIRPLRNSTDGTRVPFVLASLVHDALRGGFVMTRHISDDRLQALATDPELEASHTEDDHFSRCETCMKRFVELVRPYSAPPVKSE